MDREVFIRLDVLDWTSDWASEKYRKEARCYVPHSESEFVPMANGHHDLDLFAACLERYAWKGGCDRRTCR